MHYGCERDRQIQVGYDGQGSSVTFFKRAVRCVPLVVVAGVLTSGIGTAWAVPKETSTEKAEHLRQQANPQLFKDWTFDKDDVGSVPKGFAAVASGAQQQGAWKVEAQAAVPSAPNVVLGISSCGECHEMLVAQGFQYEYPDLVVRIQQGAGAAAGQVGVVFGMKDAQNYYATLVDVSQKIIQVVR